MIGFGWLMSSMLTACLMPQKLDVSGATVFVQVFGFSIAS
jgi:hypothetical protein